MKNYKKEWLPHLKGSIPPEAKRNRVSLYTIALEGWRRGLSLKFYQFNDERQHKKIMYSFSSQDSIHYFTESSGDLNTIQAFDICHNKGLTEKYLAKHQVPIPKGQVFTREATIEHIIDYANNMKYPLVVKPTDGSGGKGVFANVKSKKELVDAVNFIWKNEEFEELIVQQFVEGDEVRVYVLEDKVLAAGNRLPANIVGDGNHTIIQLIRDKNEIRKNTPHLHHRPIRVDNEVKSLIAAANYTLDSVLEKGERLYLRKISNVSTGGESIDVTNTLTAEQRDIAVRATMSIPGLTHCGVDMMINQQTGDTVVLEVNTKPGIGLHLFPTEGNARDIPKALMDYYFPETIHNKYQKNIFFDLQTVFDVLNDGSVNELEITPPPNATLEMVEYIVSSNLELLEFHSKVQKYILEKSIHGSIKKTNDEKICMIAAHEKPETLEQLQGFLEERSSLLQIEHIQVKEYNAPIKLGFSVIDGLQSMSLVELEVEHKQSIKESKIMGKEVARLHKRIKQMKQSKAWKVTAPLRIVTSKLKEKRP